MNRAIVAEVHRLAASGMSHRTIASELGVSRPTVAKALAEATPPPSGAPTAPIEAPATPASTAPAELPLVPDFEPAPARPAPALDVEPTPAAPAARPAPTPAEPAPRLHARPGATYGSAAERELCEDYFAQQRAAAGKVTYADAQAALRQATRSRPIY